MQIFSKTKYFRVNTDSRFTHAALDLKSYISEQKYGQPHHISSSWKIIKTLFSKMVFLDENFWQFYFTGARLDVKSHIYIKIEIYELQNNFLSREKKLFCSYKGEYYR